MINSSTNNIDISLEKHVDENEQRYLWRLDQAIRSGYYTNWNEITPKVNEILFGADEEKYKGESAYRKKVAAAREFLEAGVFTSDDNETLQKLREEQDRLYIARRQLSDQRREYNKKLVDIGRRENLQEKLIESAQKLNVECPLLDTLLPYPVSDKEALLVLTDWHYGMITDNIWNTYNVEICKARVKEIVAKTIEYVELFNINILHVVFCGDAIHGHIHVSCRVASEENTVDQLIHVSELMAETLNELSQYVNNVEFYTCCGNHARTIERKDDCPNADNLERILGWWIEQRLQNNHKVKVHYSEYKEFTLINILGYNVCCVHGDLDNIRDAATTLNTLFTRKFGKSIDLIVSGDKHHSEEFERFNIDTVIVRSLCGTDEYANNKRLYSSPGQTLMIFNKDEGRECTRNIIVH